jgi:hypothetical protein
MNFEQRINNTQYSVEIQKYRNMLEDLDDEDHVTYVTNIINHLKYDKDITKENRLKKGKESIEILSIFDNVYKKKWTSLKPIHKEKKVEEYINKIKCSLTNKNELIKEIISKITEKKKIKIEYDSSEGIITSIDNIKKKGKKYYLAK